MSYWPLFAPPHLFFLARAFAPLSSGLSCAGLRVFVFAASFWLRGLFSWVLSACAPNRWVHNGSFRRDREMAVIPWALLRDFVASFEGTGLVLQWGLGFGVWGLGFRV